MKNKRIARNLLAIFLMSFYFSCGRQDILDERTEAKAVRQVKTVLFVNRTGGLTWGYEVC